MSNTEFESFSEWRQWYFFGVSSQSAASLSLNQKQLQALFSVVSLQSVITTEALIDPKLIINEKGTTVWLLLFSLLYYNDKPGLAAVATDTSFVAIPPATIRQTFANHCNWPSALLDKFPIDLKAGSYFLLPFLLHKTQSLPVAMTQTLKSPDGELEILGCSEFDDENPALLLQELSEIRDVVKVQGN
jgi:hypothetical protein